MFHIKPLPALCSTMKVDHTVEGSSVLVCTATAETSPFMAPWHPFADPLPSHSAHAFLPLTSCTCLPVAANIYCHVELTTHYTWWQPAHMHWRVVFCNCQKSRCTTRMLVLAAQGIVGLDYQLPVCFSCFPGFTGLSSVQNIPSM